MKNETFSFFTISPHDYFDSSALVAKKIQWIWISNTWPRGYVGCPQILISAVHENVPWKAKCFTASVPITISWVHLQIMNDVWPILNPHWSFGVYTNTHQNIRLDRGCAQVVAKAYESFSDVGEIRVWFASKILSPCRMHWNAFLIAQIIAKCHSFPNMYGML